MKNLIALLLSSFISPITIASDASPFEHFAVVDLTHSFDANTIYWPTEEDFRHTESFSGDTEGGWYYSAYSVKTAEHGGTHLDAPIHFARHRWTADEIPLQRLIAPAVVVDVKEQVAANSDYEISVADLKQWEESYGPIPPGAAVLANTGFAKFWPNRLEYLGTDERGPEAVKALHFPGFSRESAEFLATQRNISAVGLDTASIDPGQSKDFMVHRILYDKNILGYENVANLDALPATGAWVMALPMKIADGSGAPLRIIGLVPEQ